MKSLFLLVKFLASVNVCIAFNTSVDQLHPVPHSLQKGRALSDGSMQRDDQAGDGKSDTAEEERSMRESIGRIFGRSRDEADLGVYQKLAPTQILPESTFTQQTRKATELAADVLDGNIKRGPSLMKELDVLQKNVETKHFADKTLMALLRKPETKHLVFDAWLKSLKSPADVATFLQRNIHNQNWLAFIEGNQYKSWLTYVGKYWDEIPKKNREASKEAVGDLLWDGRTTNERMTASTNARLTQLPIGKEVSNLVFSPTNLAKGKEYNLERV